MENSWTPWGISDHIEKVAKGITWYSTPSHGGYKLDRERNALVPPYMRIAGGWYEEDCDWAIVAIVFPIILRNDQHPEKSLEQAKASLRNWRPEAYQQYYGVELTAADSFRLRNPR